jgi:hypothetical protein
MRVEGSPGLPLHLRLIPQRIDGTTLEWPVAGTRDKPAQQKEVADGNDCGNAQTRAVG